MRSVAVIVHTTKKGRSSISTNVLRQKVPATWMFIEEVGHIVNETCDANQWTGLGLGLVYARHVSENEACPRWSLTAFPINDRQVGVVGRPGKLLLGLTQTFKFHCELTLTDFIVWEGLKDESINTNRKD